MENKLQKSRSLALKEKTQYLLTFGVIATMLLVANFPLVVIFFFGVFAYFLWKTFSQPAKQGVREVFEFYLAANEVLREDERRWFGFEVQEVISDGERILQVMHGAPPLVYFALGALYNKIGEHAAAVNHLSYVIENEGSDESTYLHPSGDLRTYVRILRKIERDPKEAPQTAAAVRALERMRKNRGSALLAESRRKAEDPKHVQEEPARIGSPGEAKAGAGYSEDKVPRTVSDQPADTGIQARRARNFDEKRSGRWKRTQSKEDDDLYGDRKPISEVLHDIYDKNVQ